MKIAGEQKEDFPLEAIASFNNPFDIWLSMNLMRGTRYEKLLAKLLSKNILSRREPSEAEQKILSEMEKKFNINIAELKNSTTWKEYDEKFTL